MAMQIVIERFNGNLSVGPWTILNLVTPLLFSDPVPDADQTAFLAAYAVHCQYLPPRAHVLRVPLILLPTFPGRQLSLQLPALHRRDALRSVTTPEFSTYPDRDRPTAPPRPSSRFRDDESVGTACSQNVHILEEQVRQLQSQLACLKIQG